MLPADLLRRNRDLARAVLRSWVPVFTHGDLQTGHVVLRDEEVTGVLDWSEAAPGDAAFDLAVLTLGFEEHLPAVLDGYGPGVDVDAVRGWWSWRSLTAIPWLVQHGFDPFAPGCEVDVLRARRSTAAGTGPPTPVRRVTGTT